MSPSGVRGASVAGSTRPPVPILSTHADLSPTQARLTTATMDVQARVSRAARDLARLHSGTLRPVTWHLQVTRPDVWPTEHEWRAWSPGLPIPARALLVRCAGGVDLPRGCR